MKVILLEDIRGRGKKDEVIEVAGGFGMHLIREKKAVEASKGGIKILDSQIEARNIQNEKLKDKALKDKAVLESKQLIFQLKVGEGGKVFKSVSHKQIVDKVMKDYNIKLDKRKFKNKDVINNLGTTNVDVELFKGIIATIKVMVKEQ